jgi:hypothetical protein
MPAWKTVIQRATAVANPVVRVFFCDRALFTIAALTVPAAAANSAPDRFRRGAGCPHLLRGFHQKKTLVVRAGAFLSHPLDYSAHINHIRRHLALLLPNELSPQSSHHDPLMLILR